MGSENFYFFKNRFGFLLSSQWQIRSVHLVQTCSCSVRTRTVVLQSDNSTLTLCLKIHWTFYFDVFLENYSKISIIWVKNAGSHKKFEISRKNDEFKVTSLALKNLIIKYFDYYKLFKINLNYFWIIQIFRKIHFCEFFKIFGSFLENFRPGPLVFITYEMKGIELGSLTC